MTKDIESNQLNVTDNKRWSKYYFHRAVMKELAKYHGKKTTKLYTDQGFSLGTSHKIVTMETMLRDWPIDPKDTK